MNDSCGNSKTCKSLSLSFCSSIFLMVDHPQILGIPTAGAPITDNKKKTLSLKHFCKIHVSTIVRWCRIKKSLPKSRAFSDQVDHLPETKPHQAPSTCQDSHQELGEGTEEETKMNGIHSYRYNSDSMRNNDPVSPEKIYKHKSVDNCFPYLSSHLSRNGSRRTPSATPSFIYRSMSRTSPESNYGFYSPVSRNGSRRSTTPIMFSNSTGILKPPAVQKNLECTLEELCYGCKKKIKVTRDVLTRTGKLVKQEEILTIDVNSGWKEGTKVTFEGLGNERPGSCPSDITFIIAEKRHPLFRREGDDLEIAVEIPLVKALTGCEISIPLLGGENMTLIINDIIYPGYEKIIRGQGMPNTKERGKRGNLKVLFLVDFPTELTDQQRSDVTSILEDSC